MRLRLKQALRLRGDLRLGLELKPDLWMRWGLRLDFKLGLDLRRIYVWSKKGGLVSGKDSAF